VYRSEIVATPVAIALVILLFVGIAFDLWSLSTVLSLFPYFIILGVATVLGWGYRSRIIRSFQGHETDKDLNPGESRLGSTRSLISRPRRSELQPTAPRPKKAGWRLESADFGILGVTLHTKATEPKVELLHAGQVKVAPGVHQELPFLLQSGDRVEGTATDFYGRDFDWSLLDDQNYAAFYADHSFVALASGFGTPSAHVDVTIPRSGTWHLVLDGSGKRSARRIDVRLTRTVVR
jgi:hypothetical protein